MMILSLTLIKNFKKIISMWIFITQWMKMGLKQTLGGTKSFGYNKFLKNQEH